jgi:NAD+ synthase/NAD+ synthase (glutamine-hydrolysing)
MTTPHAQELPNSTRPLDSTIIDSEIADALDRFLQGHPVEPDIQSLISNAQRQLGPRGSGNMALGQINTTPGDLKGNAQKIMAYTALAEQLGLDLVIFPELALMGYPPRDVIIRHPFLVQENLKWLKAIAERTGKTYALVGFVEPRITENGNQRIGKDYFNAMAILGEGRILNIVRKCLLPTYGEFEDYRQFEFSPASGVQNPETLTSADWGFVQPAPSGDCMEIHGRRYGLSICEDMWNDADFFSNPLYKKDPIAELAAHQPDVLINISASPTRSRKEQIRHNLCAHLATKYAVPYVYVNQVGTVDEVSFDGTSRVYNTQGQLIARAKAFEEQFLIVNPLKGQGCIHPLPPGLEQTLTAQKVFNAYDTSDLGRTYECLVQGIRDYFRKTGFQKAVIGLSGGLDSSVTVVLLADALGPENVLGISMPSQLTPDSNRTDAQILADNLGIQLVEVPIGAITDAFSSGIGGIRKTVEGHWGQTDPRSNAMDNVQAISRATILRQLGNEFRALPVATSDKSEFYLGYATVNGDMSGALAPIGDLPKTKVRTLARWLNEHRPSHVKTPRNALPDSVIAKPSGADLKKDPITGKLVTAEEDLMPYEFADEIIWRIEALRQSHDDMLAIRFQYEENYTLSPAQKADWLRKFYDRMAKAVFKWFIAPPILIVEGNGSIAKSDYHHPIVANRICWEGHAPLEIGLVLDELTDRITGKSTPDSKIAR